MVNQTLLVDFDTMVSVCRGITKGQFVNLFSSTNVRMNKGGRKGLNEYYDQVVKHVKGNVRPLCDYKLRMDNENEKRGLDEHVLGRNKVGGHVDEVGCVTHNEGLNRYYFMYEFFENVRVKVDYEFKGNSIEKHLFDQWVIKSSKNNVNVRQVNIENINEITIDHTKYIRVR
jgi:hypothetical protein